MPDSRTMPEVDAAVAFLSLKRRVMEVLKGEPVDIVVSVAILVVAQHLAATGRAAEDMEPVVQNIAEQIRVTAKHFVEFRDQAAQS